MGRDVFSKVDYQQTTSRFVPSSGSATSRGEEEVRNTGKLNPLVDPSENGVIRRSLPRFRQVPSGAYQLTVGTPMPIETRLDTTGSMGRNVEIALKVLPNTYELCSKMLPGYDLQIATGIFGDCEDDFVLCRPQFEMSASKIVNQLTLMYPEGRGGGNGGEDPHYGLFAGAYLTSAYINKICLRGYDFTISDEPARYQLSEKQLRRIFGAEVFKITAENGFDIDPKNLPSTEEVVADLLKRAHAFFIEINTGRRYNTHGFWTEIFGPERVITIQHIDYLPHIQAVTIGLTEGTLALGETVDFLMDNKISRGHAEDIAESVMNIPIGAQLALRKDIIIPQKGDLFRTKTDVFPFAYAKDVNEDEPVLTVVNTAPNWL